MNEGWGLRFYRRPTNPPNQKKALRECLGGSDSIENDACKQPQRQQFYRDHQLQNALACLIL